MINHTRTLLLNQLAVTCLGHAHNEYIDPNFIPVRLTVELQKIKDTLFTVSDIDIQLNTVLGFLNILHINLLEPHTLFFDSRITYHITKLNILTCHTLDISVTNIQQQLEQKLLDYNILNAVFKPVARGSIQELYNIWSQSQEMVLRLGAILLAYTYQLENMRT